MSRNLNNYFIANFGVLTYFIPRVHASVDEPFLKQVLENFWMNRSGLGYLAVTQPHWRIKRVDFVPYDNDPSFNKVFVYHDSAAPIGMSNEVVYQTRQIFEAEEKKAAVRCNFFHHGKDSYWLLLPNLNPLTVKQQQMAETIRDLQDDIIANLSIICDAGLSVPFDFKLSVLDHKHIETAFRNSLREIDSDFESRIEELREHKEMLVETLNMNWLPSAEDEECMEMLAREEEEECQQARDDDEEEAIYNETRDMWSSDNTF
jgi:hypothetical protein